jgi:hypothetical protein
MHGQHVVVTNRKYGWKKSLTHGAYRCVAYLASGRFDDQQQREN